MAAPWAVFAALVVVLLGPSLAGERVVLPHDQLFAFLPWSAVDPLDDGLANFELRDVIDQYYPSQHAITTRLQGGAGSWLPEVGLGVPGWAFVGWGALSPFTLPAVVLPFDLAWSWGMGLRLFAAMGGAFVLARGFGLGRAGATVAGVAFGLCGYMVGWLGWPQSHVGAFLPWVWAGVRVCARPTRPWWGIGALALATAGLWLGGFPSVAVWGLLGGAVVAAHAVWQHRAAGWRPAAVGGVAVAAGVGAGTALAAFTLLPTLLLLDQFDLAYRSGMWRAQVPLAALVTFAVPHFFGDVVTRQFWLPPAYVETVGYAGVVTLALALPAWVLRPSRPGVWAVTGLAAVFTAVAYGLEPLPRLLARLPLVATNPPPRALAIVGLALALLGGFGADALVRWVAGDTRLTLGAVVGATALGFVSAMGWAAGRPARWLAAHAGDRIGDPAAVADALRFSRHESLVALGLVGALTLLVVGARLVAVPWRALAAGILAAGLVGLAAVDLGRFATGWNPQVPREALFPDAPGLDSLVEASHRARVATTNRVGLPNTNLEYGFADLRSRGFQTARQREVLERIGARFTSRTLWGLDAADSAGWEPWLTVLGVRAVLGPDWVEDLPGPREPRSQDVPSGPLSSRGVSARLRVPRAGTISGVQVRVGDFGGGNVGALEAHVRVGGDAVTGRIGLPGLVDGRPAMIPVPPIDVAVGERVDIRLTGDVDDGRSGVAVYGVGRRNRFVPTVGLAFADDHTYDAVDLGPVRLFYNDRAPELVYAAGAAMEVRPGRAPDVVERLAAGGRAATVTVETMGGAPVTGLPDGGGSPEVTAWDQDGAVIRAAVEADEGAVLVALQEALDGWSATLDGEPTETVRVNHLFVGVVVPPGGGLVELRYVPVGLPAGVAVTAAAALSLVAGTGWAGWRAWRARRAVRASSTAAQAKAAAASAAAAPVNDGDQGDQASIADTPSA